jgi:hypothetical protein
MRGREVASLELVIGAAQLEAEVRDAMARRRDAQQACCPETCARTCVEGAPQGRALDRDLLAVARLRFQS